MKSLSKLLLFLFAAGLLASCEKQEYFQSESDVKKELNHSWNQVRMSHNPALIPNYYVWIFNGDSLTMIIKNSSDDAVIDTLVGSYSVRTTLTRVFVTTSNFPDNDSWYWLNTEWTDVSLSGKGLVVAAEDPRAGGIKELEFTRND
jgi:hypothetical protein